MKNILLGAHWKRLIETLSLSTHNMFFFLRNEKVDNWKQTFL